MMHHLVRIEPTKIATISAVLFLGLYTALLAVIGEHWEALLNAAVKSGAIITIIGFFWLWYCRHGWKYNIPFIKSWLYKAPNLNGRWEGTVCRLKDDTPHKFVVEITQSALELSYKTFSANSEGESITATLLSSNEEGTTFQLISNWHSYTVKLDDKSVRDNFRGTSIWTISLSDSGTGPEMSMKDAYFTEREPPTKGSGEVNWVSKSLKNKF